MKGQQVCMAAEEAEKQLCKGITRAYLSLKLCFAKPEPTDIRNVANRFSECCKFAWSPFFILFNPLNFHLNISNLSTWLLYNCCQAAVHVQFVPDVPQILLMSWVLLYFVP